MEADNADINGSLGYRSGSDTCSSPAPSCESMKSDWSMDVPLQFKKGIFGHVRCFVCSSILRDPVTTSCGHNFCVSCIEDRWSQPGPEREYICPQCEESYPTRPKLSVNEGLSALLKVLLQERCAGPACDICSSKTRPAPAIKTCKTCDISYCEKHIRCHYTVPKLQKHTLAPAN